jgi:hypothetical protein
MIQNQSTYHIEKIIQLRQADINKNIRQGLYVKQVDAKNKKDKTQADVQRGFWHKWFGSKRLNTSWK